MTHTLTLEVPEDVYRSLQQKAEERGQAPESLAIEMLVESSGPGDDPLEPFIGAFHSQGSDWADRHDAHLGLALSDPLRDS